MKTETETDVLKMEFRNESCRRNGKLLEWILYMLLLGAWLFFMDSLWIRIEANQAESEASLQRMEAGR